MSEKSFATAVGGVIVGLIFSLILILSTGATNASNYCPAILEHAPDTLAVVQEFPDCLKYTETNDAGE